MAERIDDHAHQRVTTEPAAAQLYRVDERWPGTPGGRLIQLARAKDPEGPGFCIENVRQARRDLVESSNRDDLIQREGAAKVETRETVRTAQVLQDAAPDKDVHTVHHVQSRLEPVGQRRVGLHELAGGDQ